MFRNTVANTCGHPSISYKVTLNWLHRVREWVSNQQSQYTRSNILFNIFIYSIIAKERSNGTTNKFSTGIHTRFLILDITWMPFPLFNRWARSPFSFRHPSIHHRDLIVLNTCFPTAPVTFPGHNLMASPKSSHGRKKENSGCLLKQKRSH